jgi:hypothetical protein
LVLWLVPQVLVLVLLVLASALVLQVQVLVLVLTSMILQLLLSYCQVKLLSQLVLAPPSFQSK